MSAERTNLHEGGRSKKRLMEERSRIQNAPEAAWRYSSHRATQGCTGGSEVLEAFGGSEAYRGVLKNQGYSGDTEACQRHTGYSGGTRGTLKAHGVL